MRYQDKAAELAHSKRIANRAEDFWGWASPAGTMRAKRRAGVILDEAKVTSRGTILEIGCGTGVFTILMSKWTGARVVALDISETLIGKAKDKKTGCKEADKVQFVVADLESAPFRDRSFDAVVGSSILHHLNLDLVLPELKRAVKPRGKLVFVEPNLLNPQIFAQKKIWFLKRWMGESPNETAFMRWSMAKTLAKAGYKEIAVTPIDFLHPSTPVRMLSLVAKLSVIFEKTWVLREIAGSLVISCRA